MSVQNEKDYPHADLTGKIIKCCMEAHSFLEPGFPEATYLKATNLQIGLLFNFGEQHLRFRRLINKHYDSTKSPNLPH